MPYMWIYAIFRIVPAQMWAPAGLLQVLRIFSRSRWSVVKHLRTVQFRRRCAYAGLHTGKTM